MNLLRPETFFWYLIGITVLIEFFALAFFYKLNNSGLKGRPHSINLKYIRAPMPTGQRRVFDEMERLRAGGEVDERLIKNMAAEERVIFEVALIDALTKWPDEDRLRLRSTLIRHGYKEQCARRAMKGKITDSVRALTLLNLLHEPSLNAPLEFDCFIETDSGRLIPVIDGYGGAERELER